MNTVLPLLETPAAALRAARRAPATGLTTTPFGLYVHVPFCATRCGYCDFNTYTSDELGPGANRAEYAGTAIAELRRAADTLGPDLPTVSTVFVGGGTPTLLPADDLAAVLAAARDLFPMADDVEVTTEANPESVTPASLARLREAGFTRISLGMQSAAEHVLAVLDRRHTPGPRGRGRARGARRRVRARQPRPDLRRAGRVRRRLGRLARRRPGQPGRPRVSAYALIVEDGTRLARRIARGELPMPDDDVLADRYEAADATLRDGRLRLVRGVELGDVGRRPLPAQRAVLGERQLVGRRAGRAQPRRRAALVERQAPRRLRRPAARRAEPRPGRRTAGRRRPRAGDDHARAAAARGPAADRAVGDRPRAGRGRRGAGPARRRRARGAAAPSSPTAAGCSPTP